VLRKPVKFRDRLTSHSAGVIAIVKKQVKTLNHKEFEQLVEELFGVESFENVKLTAGAGENGADVVMSVSAPFFDELNIVVQIKHHPGEDNDTTSIHQLRHAFSYYKAVAG
jgi:restriction endonuclease